jgi:hypothetical protein
MRTIGRCLEPKLRKAPRTTPAGYAGKDIGGALSTRVRPNIRDDDEEVLRTGHLRTVEESFEGRSYVTCKFPLYRPDKTALLGGYTVEIRTARDSRRR